jgi:hypothetical protein
MTQLTLVIGNKLYSSWSLRAWLVMKAFGIAFEEIVIPLYRRDSKVRLLKQSPSGKVPLLIDGDLRVWESLAIIEYLAEKSSGADMAGSRESARPRACHQCGNACRVHSVAQRLPHESRQVLCNQGQGGRGRRRRRASRGDLQQHPRAFRGGRSLSIRRVLGRRCHVCAHSDSLAGILYCGRFDFAGLHRGCHAASRSPRVVRSGAAGNLGDCRFGSRRTCDRSLSKRRSMICHRRWRP